MSGYLPQPTPRSQSDSLASQAAGTAFRVCGHFNISLSGDWEGTMSLQRSFDNSTWHTVETYVHTDGQVIQRRVFEPENGVRWRWNFTTYTTGTAEVRISE